MDPVPTFGAVAASSGTHLEEDGSGVVGGAGQWWEDGTKRLRARCRGAGAEVGGAEAGGRHNVRPALSVWLKCRCFQHFASWGVILSRSIEQL